MDLARLIESLASPQAYPHPVDRVEVIHTHISVVFLAGEFAYKLKKPLDLEFLDFTTIERRRHYCHEEVRLNRRLAAEVYLGVQRVVADRGGGARVEPELDEGGQEADEGVVDYVVCMRRLPAERTLLAMVERGELKAGLVERLGGTIAAFHHKAERGAHIAEEGEWAVVAGNCRENFEQSEAYVGRTLTRRVFEELRRRTEAALEELRPVIEDRARRQVTCDTHGDLHLDHIYLLGGEGDGSEGQGDSGDSGDSEAAHEERRLAIIDCIEFNERFRYADPVADAAFLVMDLEFRGREDLAGAFREAYFSAAGDEEGRRLLDFYCAYRAVVRGKVESFLLDGAEVGEERKRSAAEDARGHFLLALGFLCPAAERPALVIVGGLPGTGKSVLARGLSERAGFERIATDVVRKELAGLGETESGRAEFGAGIYTAEWTQRTYEACLRRADAALGEGRRVVVDASFGDDAWRAKFVELAGRLRVPVLYMQCETEAGEARRRLEARRGDASDADWAIYQEKAARWEAPSEAVAARMRKIGTSESPEATLEESIRMLKREGIA